MNSIRMKQRRQTRKHTRKQTRRVRKSSKSRRGKRGGGLNSQPPRLVRHIDERVWQAGVDYLDTHPNENEYIVQQNHPVPPSYMHWIFKVVRTPNGYDYQTILNGQRVA